MSKNARKLRISELIKRELSQILNSFTFNKDFDCSFYITVTEVDISNDLKNATQEQLEILWNTIKKEN